MIIGTFVESEECYRRRMLEQQQRTEQEARRRLARMEDLYTELILEALGEPGGPPLPITTVANVVGKRLKCCFNQNRDEAKVMVLQKVGFLIKIRRLTRINRNWVRLPENDEAHKAWLAAQDEMIKNLPGPNL